MTRLPLGKSFVLLAVATFAGCAQKGGDPSRQYGADPVAEPRAA